MKTYIFTHSFNVLFYSPLRLKGTLFTILAALLIVAAIPSQSAAQCPNNLVSNSTFSSGIPPWQTFSGYLPNPVPNTLGCLDTFMVLRAYQNTSVVPPVYGDGLYQPAVIDSGKCYNLCLCMATALGMPGNNVQFWAATNDPGVTFNSLMNNTYPAGEAALIGTIQVNSNTAQQYCINNWYAQKNFTRLIIFNSTTSQIQASVLLDNICFSENLACTPCDYANIVPNFSAQANGTMVQFTDLSTIAVGNITGWEWDFNDPGNAPNDTSTLQNPVFNFSATGVYIVCLKVYAMVNGHPCEDSTCFCVPVFGNPVNAGCDTTGMNNGFNFTVSNDTATFNAFSNSAISYNWDFGDPSSGPNNTSALQNPVHVFSGPGAYNVCVIISFAGSTGSICRDTVCRTVNIVVTGINENHTQSFSVYPNPAGDFVTIGDAGESTLFEIFDYAGKLMMRGSGNTINVKPLARGLYIIRNENRYGRFLKL